MVREVRNSLGSTNLPAPISKPQAQRDIARPVDTAITGSSKDSTFNSFIQGLSSINPALQRYAQNRMDEQNHQEVEQGKRDAILGQEKQSDAELYAHGYMKIKGTNAAAEDMAELQGYLEQNYNPDSDDFQGTVKGWLKNKTSPSTDKAFLEGYAPIMDRAINQLSNHYTTVRVNKLKADVESTAMQNLGLGMRAYIEKGEPIPDEFILGKKQEFANHFKMSEAKFEELQFLAAKEYGDKGNFAVYEQFKKNKPDGTPGMYFNPAWKEKIDAAEYHATGQYLKMSKEREAQRKADREERQGQALQSVFMGALTGDYGDAARAFKRVVAENPDLFLTKDINEWTNRFTTLKGLSALEETAEQELNDLKLLDRIQKGQATTKHVMEAAMSGEISRNQAGRLINAVNSYNTQQRQFALQERQLQKSTYDSPQYKQAEGWLTRTLTAQDDLIKGLNPAQKQEAAQVRANALLELGQRSNGLPPADVQALANELATRYSKMLPVNSVGTARVQQLKGGLRFQTPEELLDAAERGLISRKDFAYQTNIFKELNDDGP